jgi:hypothetical protein
MAALSNVLLCASDSTVPISAGGKQKAKIAQKKRAFFYFEVKIEGARSTDQMSGNPWWAIYISEIVPLV